MRRVEDSLQKVRDEPFHGGDEPHSPNDVRQRDLEVLGLAAGVGGQEFHVVVRDGAAAEQVVDRVLRLGEHPALEQVDGDVRVPELLEVGHLVGPQVLRPEDAFLLVRLQDGLGQHVACLHGGLNAGAEERHGHVGAVADGGITVRHEDGQSAADAEVHPPVDDLPVGQDRVAGAEVLDGLLLLRFGLAAEGADEHVDFIAVVEVAPGDAAAPHVVERQDAFGVRGGRAGDSFEEPAVDRQDLRVLRLGFNVELLRDLAAEGRAETGGVDDEVGLILLPL